MSLKFRSSAVAAFTLNVGNTHSRLIGWSSRGELVSWKPWETRENPLRYLAAFNASCSIPLILGGVVPDVKETIVDALRNSGCKIHVFRSDIQPRMKILPRPPERVGDDRIASALGALAIDPSRPWVIVDAGTATTINAVTPGRNGRLPRFEGGLIVPGAAMSLEALAHFTAQLPSLSAKRLKHKYSFIGRNTEEAMLLGVYQANVATAAALAKGQLKELGPRARIALTGGGGESPGFQKAFKETCPAGCVSIHPHLVDLGLFSCWKEASHT